MDKDRYIAQGIVTKPINVADLSQLLNRSQDNLEQVEYSNLLTSVGGLCTHQNINMWAKSRPMAGLPMREVTDYQRANVGYGLSIPFYKSLAELDAAFRSGTADWQIKLPTGGENSPYSLAHFIDYNHKAHVDAWSMNGELTDDYGHDYKNSVLGVYLQRDSGTLHPGSEVFARIDVDETLTSSYAIQFKEIENVIAGEGSSLPLNYYYFGVVLLCEDSDYESRLFTAITPIYDEEGGGRIVRIKLPNSLMEATGAVNWHIIPVLCSGNKDNYDRICIIGESKYFMKAEFEAHYEPTETSIQVSNGTVTASITSEEDITINEMWVAVMHREAYAYDLYYPQGLDEDVQNWRYSNGTLSRKDYYDIEGKKAGELRQVTIGTNGSIASGASKSYTLSGYMSADGSGRELTDESTVVCVCVKYSYDGTKYSVGWNI